MADSMPAGETTSTARAGRISLHLALIALGVVAMHLFLWEFADRRPPMQNVQWWQAIAELMHSRGFFNVWTPYPPVFPAVFYAASRVLPAETARTVTLAWKTCNILLLIGQASLIFLLVRRLLPERAEFRTKTSLLAVLAFTAAMWQPRSMVLLGPWMDQFDYLPAFMMLLAVFLLVRSGRTQGSPLHENDGRTQGSPLQENDGRTQGSPLHENDGRTQGSAVDKWPGLTWRETASAMVCGIGIMTKLFPGLLVLAAWPLLGWRRGLRYAGIAAAACVVLALPSAIANREMFLSPARYTASRPAWESVWAYAFPAFHSDRGGRRDPLAAMPPAPHPQIAADVFTKPYRVEDDPQLRFWAAAWGPRRQFGPTNLIALPLFAIIAATAIAGMRACVRTTAGFGHWALGSRPEKSSTPKPKAESPTPSSALIRGLLVILLGFLLCSKGFSTYFIVWIVPLLCIAYPGAGGFAISAVLVLLGNAELLGYMGRVIQEIGNRDAIIFFTKLGPPGFQFWGSIFVRHAILMAVMVHQMHRLWNNREIAV